MSTSWNLPANESQYTPRDTSGRAAVAVPLLPRTEPVFIITDPEASNQPEFHTDDESPAFDMRWVPLLVPALGGLMAGLFFVVGWLALALPLARHQAPAPRRPPVYVTRSAAGEKLKQS